MVALIKRRKGSPERRAAMSHSAVQSGDNLVERPDFSTLCRADLCLLFKPVKEIFGALSACANK